MINTRVALIVTGLAFGLWEAVDIFRIDVPAVAAVFAAVFLGCTAWFWRRGSLKAVAFLLVFFVFEVAVAPRLKHVLLVTKLAAGGLALAGASIAIVVLLSARRLDRSLRRGLTEAGS